MRIVSALLLVALCPPLAAQQTDAANSRDHGLFPRVDGYYITSYRTEDPASEQFWARADGGRDTVIGRITRIGYGLQRPTTREPVSALGLVQHYEALVRQMGGEVLFRQTTFGQIGARVTQGGREYWIRVHLENRTEYGVTIGERDVPRALAAAPAMGAPGAGLARRVMPRGTRAPTFTTAPRLNLGPTITGISPDRRRSGEIVAVAGTNLNHATAVRFLDAQGRPWDATVFTYEECSDNLRVVVPQLPAGQYRVAVQTPMGTGQSAAILAVFQNPINEAPEAGAKTRVAMRRILEWYVLRGMVTPAGAAGLNRRLNAREILEIGPALDALNDVMTAEAEGYVGGPVAQSIIAVALSSGRPLRDVAMGWRHCHAFQREMGIGGAGGVARAGVGIGSPPAGEGRVYGACGGANSTGERWHSHITPMDIGNAVELNQHIRDGTAPGQLPAHYHTETGFAAGTVWYASINNDAWYEDLVDGAVGMAEWAYEHSDTMISVVKIVGLLAAGTAGCIIGVVFTLGTGCAAAFVAVAGPIMKETTKILIQEEVITVSGVSKETMLAGVDAIPVG